MVQGGAVSKEEYEGMRRENDELKEVLTAVQLDLEARQSDLAQRDMQLKDTNTQLVAAKTRIAVSTNVNSYTSLLITWCVAHLQSLEEENGGMKVRESELEDQLHMAGVASRRKMEEAGEGHAQLGQLLQEAIRLHQSLSAHYKL